MPDAELELARTLKPAIDHLSIVPYKGAYFHTDMPFVLPKIMLFYRFSSLNFL